MLTENNHPPFSQDTPVRQPERTEGSEQKTFDAAAVYAEIEKDEVIPKTLIQLLSTDTELASLYAADAGVSEGYSVEQHTEMVLTQFERYFSHRMEKENRAFMRVVLALHDIGKPVSLRETGGVKKQHAYTLPVLSRVLAQMSYPPEAISFAQAVVNQDYIGELLKGNLLLSDPDFKKTRAEIQARARENSITPEEYLKFIRIFYLADASSYTADTAELGGTESLDFLFSFNHEKRRVKFSENPLWLIDFETPADYYRTFEDAVLRSY